MIIEILSPIDGLVAYAGRLGRAVFDPPGRFPFHQVGHPRLPRYLWPLEQVFQPPRFAFGIASPRALIITASPTSRSRATPAERVINSECHSLGVTVDKPGITARTRTGYYAQP